MIKGLYGIGLYPIPQGPKNLYGSILWYWKCLKGLGADFKPYHPCDKIGHGRQTHWSSCTFTKCLDGFGIMEGAEAILKDYTHKDVFNHMQSVSDRPLDVLNPLIKAGRLPKNIALSSYATNEWVPVAGYSLSPSRVGWNSRRIPSGRHFRLLILGYNELE
jgi:hypothetical protein